MGGWVGAGEGCVVGVGEIGPAQADSHKTTAKIETNPFNRFVFIRRSLFIDAIRLEKFLSFMHIVIGFWAEVHTYVI
jgi:hypothetical protein